MSYKEKFVQMNKEAKATWIVTAIIIAFWWISGFGIYNVFGSDWRIFYMPAWFVVACFGTWILTIIGVTFLTKVVFKDFELEDEDLTSKEGDII